MLVRHQSRFKISVASTFAQLKYLLYRIAVAEINRNRSQFASFFDVDPKKEKPMLAPI
jgi:hypothetical protein